MTIDGLRQHRLAPEHIPGALRLSAEPGWNQIEADWRWMIENGDSFGLSTLEDQLVASGLTVQFNGPFAWISMILVTAAYRRRGLATHLMRSCIETLQNKGLVPALDASPAGHQVYLPLGFRDIYRTTRMLGSQPPANLPDNSADADIAAVNERNFESIRVYDRVPSGTDRSELLRHLLDRKSSAAFLANRAGRISGFVLARDGRLCSQVGPLVADDADIALTLVQQALASISGPVCLDVGDHHMSLRAWLDAHGFVPITPFVRMIQGRSEPYDDPQRVFVIAGPDLG